jgi:phage terminase Nu1 subunit (DNA packaging protein)
MQMQRKPYAVSRGMYSLEPVLADDEAAAQTWSELEEPERRAVARWAGRPISIKARRDRLQQVCFDLRQGADQVRSRLPKAS